MSSRGRSRNSRGRSPGPAIATRTPRTRSKTSRSTRIRSSSSPEQSRGNKSRKSFRQVFNEFREVFDGDNPDSDSSQQQSKETDDSQILPTENEQDDGPSVTEEEPAPAWAKQLIAAHVRSSRSYDTELKKLQRQVNSLKRKRDSRDDQEWKYKGNKHQSDFNISVLEQLEDAKESNSLETAKRIVDKGIALIKNRNKLIKIADRDGWDTVTCYEEDPLAGDDHDDKRLRRARKEAERLRVRKKSEKDAKSAKRNRSYKSRGGYSGWRGPNYPRFEGYQGRDSRVLLSHASQDNRLSIPRCFRCNKPGHIQKDCTLKP